MKSVAVFFGGQSAEHDVSIVTAILAVINPLKTSTTHKAMPVYISKTGTWFMGEEFADIKTYQSKDFDSFLSTKKPVSILFQNGLTLTQPGKFGKQQTTPIDIAFPAMHGTKGEDGALMGLLDLANIPYVGCNLKSSAIAMDKVVCKQVIEANDLPTPKMTYFTKNEYKSNKNSIHQRIEKDLSFPLFVKPASLGSSIAVAKVANSKELAIAIEVALHYDDKALVEEAVANLVEVTVPILGNSAEIETGIVEQPARSADDPFDFDAKYIGPGGKKMGASSDGAKMGSQGYSYLPARISKKLIEESESVAKKAYTAIGCQGTARVDLLINDKTKQVYFNEINPMPGGLYDHNWRAAGRSSVDLVQKLLELAEQRYSELQKTSFSFETNFLRQF